jgi:hypothetical protein
MTSSLLLIDSGLSLITKEAIRSVCVCEYLAVDLDDTANATYRLEQLISSKGQSYTSIGIFVAGKEMTINSRKTLQDETFGYSLGQLVKPVGSVIDIISYRSKGNLQTFAALGIAIGSRHKVHIINSLDDIKTFMAVSTEQELIQCKVDSDGKTFAIKPEWVVPTDPRDIKGIYLGKTESMLTFEQQPDQ